MNSSDVIPRSRSPRQRGAALLAAVVVGAAIAISSAGVVATARSLAAEFAARRDVACARYGALAGLALGAPTTDSRAAAALVAGRATSVAVRYVRRSPSWCVLRSTAVCGDARRTVERTVADPDRCL